MLYRFKSQADADVIMTEANGDQMLAIIGKAPARQGVITVDQIPAAIDALQAAVTAHEASQANLRAGLSASDELPGDGVMIRHRTAPFIELLRSSVEAGKDVVWGV
jgi:hypothetical protein